MSRFNSVIFDLDGTLWDASEATAVGWTRVATEFGLNTAITADQVRAVSGLPFDRCVNARFGDAAAAIPGLRERLEHEEEVAVRDGSWRVYEGARELLERLSKERPLYLVSNCQEWYLDIFLKDAGLAIYFRRGLSHGGTGLPKAEMIRSLLVDSELKPALYVGDTHWDQAAAYRAGASFAFVDWGFGAVSVSCPKFSSFETLGDFALRENVGPTDVELLDQSRYEEARSFYKRVGYFQPVTSDAKIVAASLPGGDIAGVVRLEKENGVLVLRGMQVSPELQSAGVGLRMIKLLEEKIDSECWCMPHDWLTGFYGKVGFRRVEAEEAPEFLRERFRANVVKYPHLILMKRDPR